MILWDGLYEGIPKKLTWVGSLNFTNPALNTNDENMLMVDEEGIYDYLNNFFQEVDQLAN